jgi:hypothetical protein
MVARIKTVEDCCGGRCERERWPVLISGSSLEEDAPHAPNESFRLKGSPSTSAAARSTIAPPGAWA